MMLGIMCHQIPVEAHWLIGKVEKYHAPVRHAYDIIQVGTRGIISRNAMLQMVFKAVNDTTRPNSLVPTLLVFGVYPCIVMDSSYIPLQQQQANTIAKVMSELHKLKVWRGIQDAFNARNGLDTIQTLLLALNLGSEVQTFWEEKR